MFSSITSTKVSAALSNEVSTTAVAQQNKQALDENRTGLTVDLALISHTNAGKTTLARTLLGQDIGEVRDAPHVTRTAEVHRLLSTPLNEELRLWDTPGFGDSERLLKRLAQASNPIGWLLREVWDRHQDRPLWCSQHALRAAKEQADVLLYLVNASEGPSDAGYIQAEMQVLAWVGRPIIVLLNQMGAPRPSAQEAVELAQWQQYFASFKQVSQVLSLDAFARCWLQEIVLLEAIEPLLRTNKKKTFNALREQWRRQHNTRFEQAIDSLSTPICTALLDAEVITGSNLSYTQLALNAVGVQRGTLNQQRDAAMKELTQRLNQVMQTSANQLIALHQLQGTAVHSALQRLASHFYSRDAVNESQVGLFSGALTGALAGLKADMVSGGASLGAGFVIGGLAGGAAGLGLVRGVNRWRGEPVLTWSNSFLSDLVQSSLLRYLAVAHFGRGRGQWVENEAPAFWQELVAEVVKAHEPTLHMLWQLARDNKEHNDKSDKSNKGKTIHKPKMDAQDQSSELNTSDRQSSWRELLRIELRLMLIEVLTQLYPQPAAQTYLKALIERPLNDA